MSSLYKKILDVKEKIAPLSKKGHNDNQNYSFLRDEDIVKEINPIINKAGLLYLPSQETVEIGFSDYVDYKKNAKTRRWAKVRMNFKIVDVDTGEVELSSFEGYAEDNGDKAVNKATTSAQKYFMVKYFGIATADDQEGDTTIDEPTQITSKSGQPMYKAANGYEYSSEKKANYAEEKKQLISDLKETVALLKLNQEQARAVTGATFNGRQSTLDELIIARDALLEFANRREQNKLTDRDIQILEGKTA